ncbi:hypothetical protein, partial [Streptomyces stackebrandtii]|uniref:hypothetical protein n=1 Tax=Streptomyces stackebrandtii TaxID=3051177 RepID=UPI0028DC58F0
VREQRFADERPRRRALRNSGWIVLWRAPVGVTVVFIARVVLAWFDEPVALGIVGGIFLLWFAIALTWVHADGGRGRHAFRRAYSATFGWGGGF